MRNRIRAFLSVFYHSLRNVMIYASQARESMRNSQLGFA